MAPASRRGFPAFVRSWSSTDVLVLLTVGLAVVKKGSNPERAVRPPDFLKFPVKFPVRREFSAAKITADLRRDERDLFCILRPFTGDRLGG
jgi:hypothetical protein